MNLKIGLVGLGTGGRSLPLAVAKTQGFEFVAGADLRKEGRERYRAEFGIQTYESVEALCALKELDCGLCCHAQSVSCRACDCRSRSRQACDGREADGANFGGLRPHDRRG